MLYSVFKYVMELPILWTTLVKKLTHTGYLHNLKLSKTEGSLQPRQQDTSLACVKRRLSKLQFSIIFSQNSPIY